MPDSLAILLAATLVGGLALASLCGRRPRARWVRIIAAVAGVSLFVLSVGDGWSIAALLLLLAAVLYVCEWTEVSGWRTIASAAAVPLVFVGALGAWRVQKLRRIDTLREKYPLVSIRDRLPGGEATLSADESASAARASQFDDLAVGEARALQRAEYRAAALSDLHSEFLKEFEASPGFGVVRMRRVPHRFVVLSPAVPPAPLPSAPVGPSLLEETGATAGHEPSLPKPQEMKALHQRARAGFLAPETFGYVRDVDHVAGFEPHAFRGPFDSAVIAPPDSAEEGHPADAVAWKVTTLQLVGLVQSEVPRVYEMDGYPDMGRVRDAPTRPLDPFEREALPRLDQEDLVTEIGRNRIQMLGALRGSGKCLECHHVPKRTLLGAFRYVLSRDPAVAEPKPTL